MESTPPSSVPTASNRPIFLGVTFVLAALIISASIIVSAVIKDNGAARDSQFSRSMSITGHATKVVTSDRMKWSLTLSRTGASSSTVASVTAQLGSDIDSVVAALAAAGVSNPTVSRHPAEVSSYSSGAYSDYGNGSTYQPSTNINGQQVVVIESNDVNKMNDASNGIVAKLNASGAYVQSNTTEFYYSNTDELRHQLLDAALTDAREQAQKAGGDQLGPLLQVTANSYLSLTPASGASSYYGGSDDTSSIEKKASFDVTVSYALKK